MQIKKKVEKKSADALKKVQMHLKKMQKKKNKKKLARN
jgi:hypothetical protein